MSQPLPVLFLSHGSPMVALDPTGGGFKQWGRVLPRPEAILAISAHWERTPPTLGIDHTGPLIYDFGSFPPELYQVTYPAPPAPRLRMRVMELLAPLGEVGQEPGRGWDHGVWTPLVHLFPQADIPLVQLSLPSRWGGEQLIELGRALAPLRHEGVLIAASGVLVHNLRAIKWRGGEPEGWASNFDQWVVDRLAAWDLPALASAHHLAPGFKESHPTDEHYLPLLVAVGAADAGPHAVSYPISGFQYGNLSNRSVQLG
ncbi:MAG: dioxygenase [Alphaproteobacteria bacterium CG_4_10_14_0_2_um_filter_63_37]|nr:MAG: hypothetical protein AUJ55_00965 [Proteobacteria bacterium CG1_02_64_396]PJA26056.1 MAG: dioxygenase [Alphaproteobacteria bacterium CG_4_10_14_0_2_um_filter_63_37]